MAPTVILIGFMGSGKTSVGRDLARKLDWDFFDADTWIEEREGMPVSRIFADRGEGYFRETEAAVVTGLLDEAKSSRRGAVISLGGGAVMTPAVAGKLRREPLVVLLDVDEQTAFGRIHGRRRPLARDRDTFRRLFADREKQYRRLADYVVDTKDKGVAAVASEVASIISGTEGAG